jgi:telomere resolvase
MASKWLEERWERLLPVLSVLGQEQEEQIKLLCGEELQAWRQRPSIREVNSLRQPLTQTRNRIRETFQITETNCWINPKSGAREHLSLKYLNFSSQEWIQMTIPSEEELQYRQAHPLPLRNVSALVSKVEHLLQMKTWPELVVGLGLATGRGLVEVLKTGHFTPCSAYIVWFAGPMTVYERMCDPFEVPTLVRADLVLEALRRVRGFFQNHFAEASRREVSRECSEEVQDAIYRHWLGSIPLRSEEQNSYRQLTHGVYPRLAAYLYCPSSADEILYLATIQRHQKILESPSEAERLTLVLAAGYRDYVILDDSGTVDTQRGIRLGEADVEIISVFREKTEIFVREREPLEQAESRSENKDVLSDDGEKQPHIQYSEAGDAISPESTERVLSPKSIQSGQEREELIEEEEDWGEELDWKEDHAAGMTLEAIAKRRSRFTADEWEAYEDAVRNSTWKEMQEEQAAINEQQASPDYLMVIFLDDLLIQRLKAVKQREGTISLDRTLTVLLDRYAWLTRGGSIPQVFPKPFERDPLMRGYPYPIPDEAIRQKTANRLQAIDPKQAARGIEYVIGRLLDMDEWVLQGNLAKQLSTSQEWSPTLSEEEDEEEDPTRQGVEDLCDIFVLEKTRERFDGFARKWGMVSDDETLLTLLGIQKEQRVVMAEVNVWFQSILESEGKTEPGWHSGDEKETSDQTLNRLMDIAERHPSAVSLYFYHRLLAMLAPLEEELGRRRLERR